MTATVRRDGSLKIRRLSIQSASIIRNNDIYQSQKYPCSEHRPSPSDPAAEKYDPYINLELYLTHASDVHKDF